MTQELSTRDRIIHASAELMEQNGYHGTGLNDIVRHSGAPKGSIYHYFPDGKEEIASETIEMVERMIYEDMRETLDAHDDPAEAVQAVINTIMARLQTYECKRSGMPSPMEMASVSEALRIVVERGMEARRTLFEQKLILSGIDDQHAHNLSWFITTAILGAIMMSRVHENTQPLENIASQIFGLIQSAKP